MRDTGLRDDRNPLRDRFAALIEGSAALETLSSDLPRTLRVAPFILLLLLLATAATVGLVEVDAVMVAPGTVQPLKRLLREPPEPSLLRGMNQDLGVEAFFPADSAGVLAEALGEPIDLRLQAASRRARLQGRIVALSELPGSRSVRAVIAIELPAGESRDTGGMIWEAAAAEAQISSGRRSVVAILSRHLTRPSDR